MFALREAICISFGWRSCLLSGLLPDWPRSRCLAIAVSWLLWRAAAAWWPACR